MGLEEDESIRNSNLTVQQVANKHKQVIVLIDRCKHEGNVGHAVYCQSGDVYDTWDSSKEIASAAFVVKNGIHKEQFKQISDQEIRNDLLNKIKQKLNQFSSKDQFTIKYEQQDKFYTIEMDFNLSNDETNKYLDYCKKKNSYFKSDNLYAIYQNNITTIKFYYVIEIEPTITQSTYKKYMDEKVEEIKDKFLSCWREFSRVTNIK